MHPAEPTPEIETLKKVFAAINRNDIPALIEFFAPDIQRIEPLGFPSAGTYRGHADVIKHLSQGRSTWAEGTCEPERFFTVGNKVIAFLHVRVRLKNKTEWIDARFPDGFAFRDGKVVTMHSFANTEHALKWAGVTLHDYKQNLIERAIWENSSAGPGQELVATPQWVLAPSSSPSDLSARLIKKGLVLKEKLFGMFADTQVLKLDANSEIKVVPLTLENLEDWLNVQADAWSVPPQGIAYQRGSMTATLQKAAGGPENYLAYLDGKPVGSAAMRITENYGYLMGGAVTAQSRGHGVYRALLAHRLNKIAELGLPAIVHCLEKTSAPICVKLGFEKICEIDSYEQA